MGKFLDRLIRPLAKMWEIEDSFSIDDLEKGFRVRVDKIIGVGIALKEDGRASVMTEAVAKKAVDLYYRLGKNSGFLFTGGYACNGVTEAKAMKKIALVEKIPACLITLEEESVRTWMNAVESRKIMERYSWHSAIVVSQHIHSRKVRAIFKEVFTGSKINLYFIKARSGYEKIPQRRFTSEARFLLTWEIPTYFYSKLKGWA